MSAQQKLKLFTRVPGNGLVIFVGIISTDDGKEKRVNIDFEPFKPLTNFLYHCDNKFHTEVISSCLYKMSSFTYLNAIFNCYRQLANCLRMMRLLAL